MREGNVLFVTFDQLRADVLDGRLAGLVPLPALTRLAREGTRYANCWTAAVPCGPARASLLTGLHAFTHRVVRNGTPLARHHATLATELRKLGREPLLFGYNDVAADPTGRDPADPDFRSYELPAAGFREIAELRFEAPMGWIGHLRARGLPVPSPQPERVWEIYAPRATGRAARPDDPPMYAAADSDSAWLADRTLEALSARRDHPWTAHVTFLRPHPPFTAPEPFNRLVAPGAVPPPLPAPEGPAHPFRTAWFSEPSCRDLWIGFDGEVAGLDPATVQVLRAVYLGLAAEADAQLGRLLDWLDAEGLAERTLVVVMSDHGEMLGDQGFWGKDAPFAAAHRVPLVIRDPRRPGGEVVTQVTSSLDVAPTILAWLGAEAPPAMDGRPLPPAAGAGPRAALTEIDWARPGRPTRFERVWGLDPHRCNAAVLREARWSLVHFNGGLPPLLFDREADPEETRDLAGDPGAAAEIARLRAAMLDLRMTRADRRLTGFGFGV